MSFEESAIPVDVAIFLKLGYTYMAMHQRHQNAHNNKHTCIRDATNRRDALVTLSPQLPLVTKILDQGTKFAKVRQTPPGWKYN